MKKWIKKWWYIILCTAVHCLFIATLTQNILFSYYKVEELQYGNIDFEWVDDFGNYELEIIHNNKRHWATIKDSKVKFIYTNDDFLNFAIINYEKRIIDKLEKYSVKAFYINLNYKENEDDN